MRFFCKVMLFVQKSKNRDILDLQNFFFLLLQNDVRESQNSQ